MRLFIAINFNDDTRDKLTNMRDELLSRSKRGNFSHADNLHLTLAFLGECDAAQCALATAALNATDFDPFPIKVDRVGRFRRDGGDIWWAGLQLSTELKQLQSTLTDKLSGAGFELDSRRFSPHITLGREIFCDSNPWTIEAFGEIVTRIELMKSERIKGRLTYTAIWNRTT